jgi:LAO/AO transport system kinase
LDTDTVKKLLSGDRNTLARLITLAESNKEEHHQVIHPILQEIIPNTGQSIRIGITGAPGVGKSTFIESFGNTLVSYNKKVAVLSVDPSSPNTKGSILGDKTRMEKLSKEPNAFIRPTASQSFPGGVSHATRETILLCEAAGFDVIIDETVGAGQSEFSVKDMTDCFLLLMIAGAGDELQGIKKGIVEMADIIAITKADGDNAKKAQHAQAEFQQALHLIAKGNEEWNPTVIQCSALENSGIEECWTLIQKFIEFKKENDSFQETRKSQLLTWLNDQLVIQLKKQVLNNRSFSKHWNEVISKVQEKQWTVFKAVNHLMENATS